MTVIKVPFYINSIIKIIVAVFASVIVVTAVNRYRRMQEHDRGNVS